jgi:hypothetical protein
MISQSKTQEFTLTWKKKKQIKECATIIKTTMIELFQKINKYNF